MNSMSGFWLGMHCDPEVTAFTKHSATALRESLLLWFVLSKNRMVISARSIDQRGSVDDVDDLGARL